MVRQAALTCLGHAADQSSHKTWNVYIGAAVKVRTRCSVRLTFCLHLLHVPFQFITGMAPVAEDDLAEDVRDATGLQHSAFVVDDEMVRDGAEGSDNEGDAGLFVDQSDSLHVCAQHEHYALRGAELEDMNLYEYAGTSVRMRPIVACSL